MADLSLGAIPLKNLMLSDSITFSEKEPLKNVIKAMQSNATGSVLIFNGDELEGIFTERDFITRIIGQNIALNIPVHEYHTREVYTLSINDSLEDAVRLMVQKKIRHIPLLNESGKAQKIISIRDVIDYLAEFFPHEVLNLPPDFEQVPKTVEGG